MGFRFRRSLKLFPGVRIFLSRSGISTSIGTRGAHITVGHGKVRETVGLPGTGLSYTHVEGTHQEAQSVAPAAEATTGRVSRRWWLIGLILPVAAALWALASTSF